MALVRSNRQIVKNTISTTGLQAGGILNPEQAQKFIQQTFENTALGGVIRHETRRAKTGEITQIGTDLEDLYLNGDTAVAESDEDHDFLYVNDGWVKQLKNGSHVVDRSAQSGGALNLDVFYDTLKAIPNKYNNGKLRRNGSVTF